ncbi:hypothetical protein [Peribacillus muralis]|uniref:hypothetical protein n=1 Tax=Peribacillus muralis TaxID=264697 RepID=UPI003CFCE64E
MEIIKEIVLDSEEVKEAISQYLKSEGFKAVEIKFKTKPNMLQHTAALSYPVTASITVEDMEDSKTI